MAVGSQDISTAGRLDALKQLLLGIQEDARISIKNPSNPLPVTDYFQGVELFAISVLGQLGSLERFAAKITMSPEVSVVTQQGTREFFHGSASSPVSPNKKKARYESLSYEACHQGRVIYDTKTREPGTIISVFNDRDGAKLIQIHWNSGDRTSLRIPVATMSRFYEYEP